MIRHLYVVTSFFWLCCAFGEAQSTCTPPPSGIVAWWPGDGNASDIVGGNNGIMQGVTFAPGEVGQAFSFDGSTAYVQVQSSPPLQPASAITVGAWVYMTGLPPAQHLSCILTKYDTYDAGAGASWILSVADSGQIEWQVSGPDYPISYTDIATVASIQLSSWHHVAATFDATTQNSLIYVDGS